MIATLRIAGRVCRCNLETGEVLICGRWVADDDVEDAIDHYQDGLEKQAQARREMEAAGED